MGSRRLLLRLPGAVRRRRQGRGRALGVGRVAPRGRRAQGAARGLARQDVPQDLHGHLPPGRARGGLLHDPVVAVRALVPADRRGGGQPSRDPARRVRGDALPARRRFLFLVRRPGTGRHRVDLPPRAGGVHARNALRLPLLRAADVPGRHAHPAADPQRPLARRPDGALRPLGFRLRPPSGRPRGHELPDARHAGEPHVHDVLDPHVPRLPHVARRRGVPARADARRAPRAHEPRAPCGRGRPPARPARLELHGLGTRVARPGGGGRAAGLPRRRRARVAHEPPLPQRAQGGGGRRRGPGGGGVRGDLAGTRLAPRRVARAPLLGRGARRARRRADEGPLQRTRAVPRDPRRHPRARPGGAGVQGAGRGRGSCARQFLLRLLPLRDAGGEGAHGPHAEAFRRLAHLPGAGSEDDVRGPGPRPLPQRLPCLERVPRLLHGDGARGRPAGRAVLPLRARRAPPGRPRAHPRAHAVAPGRRRDGP